LYWKPDCEDAVLIFDQSLKVLKGAIKSPKMSTKTKQQSIILPKPIISHPGTQRKIYCASRYSRREEMFGYAQKMRLLGHEVTARWLNGNELGLTSAEIALLDYEDVCRADLLIWFTEPLGLAMLVARAIANLDSRTLNTKNAGLLGPWN
jgi:hypothetical protein